MTYLPNALYMTIDEITSDILSIPTKGFKPNPNTNRIWSPIGVTWHNTGVPSIGQWNKYSDFQKKNWGNNLNDYYKGMGWHSGPHACGALDIAIKLCDWLADGIHATCYNENEFGVETLLNAVKGGDDPTNGQGLLSMTSSAAIIAALCHRFGFDVEKAVNFHRECTADHHSCPGDLVSDGFAWGLVKKRLAAIQAASMVSVVIAKPTSSPPPASASVVIAKPTSSPPPASASIPLAIPQWPYPDSPMWVRAAEIVLALRAKGAQNPLIIAALANGYAESAMTPKVVGDNDEAYSIWQWHFTPRGEKILSGTNIDVRTEIDVYKLVDALIWELENVYPKTFEKLKTATNGVDATRIFCQEFEGAGAANAVERRALEASYLEVWLNNNEPFIVAHKKAA